MTVEPDVTAGSRIVYYECEVGHVYAELSCQRELAVCWPGTCGVLIAGRLCGERLVGELPPPASPTDES